MRKVVRDGRRSIVSDIEVRIAVLVRDGEVVGTVIQGVRPRIGRDYLKSIDNLPLKFELQGVVAGGQSVLELVQV